MNNVITNRDGQLVSVVGKIAVDAFRLRLLATGLKFELKCPKMKFSRISALATAKRITGLKTNDRAKHLAEVERMLADQVAKCEVVTVNTEVQQGPGLALNRSDDTLEIRHAAAVEQQAIAAMIASGEMTEEPNE